MAYIAEQVMVLGVYNETERVTKLTLSFCIK